MCSLPHLQLLDGGTLSSNNILTKTQAKCLFNNAEDLNKQCVALQMSVKEPTDQTVIQQRHLSMGD